MGAVAGCRRLLAFTPQAAAVCTTVLYACALHAAHQHTKEHQRTSQQQQACYTAATILFACCRGRWLLGLLILQSTSSFVLDQYQELLREHLVVTLFLTMLVGAGGNAGNQSAIKVSHTLLATRACRQQQR